MGVSFGQFLDFTSESQKFILLKMLEVVIGEEKTENIINEVKSEIKEYNDSLLIIDEIEKKRKGGEENDWDDYSMFGDWDDF